MITQERTIFNHKIQRSGRKISIDAAERRPILKNKGVVRIFVIFQDRPMFVQPCKAGVTNNKFHSG